MIIRFKRVLATMPLFVSLALIPLWADFVAANPIALTPEQLNALAAQADKNRHDLPNISYTYIEGGFKITVSRITFEQVVDFTLNGEIITDVITSLIDDDDMIDDDDKKIQFTKNDKGFEFDVALEPTTLGNGTEFGVILDTGVKISSVIYDESKSVHFAINGLYTQLVDSLGKALNWDNQPKNRMLVKGYVKQSVQNNCGLGLGCDEMVLHHWVNIYAHDGHNWVHKDTVYTDEYGFYSLLIENHCGLVGAYTAKDGKEVWQHEDVWTSCSPSINEQSIILKLK